jgi:hypothetical protein
MAQTPTRILRVEMGIVFVRTSSATRRFEGDSMTPTTANLAACAPRVEPCRERRDAPCVRTLAASRRTRLVNGLVKRDRKRTFLSLVGWWTRGPRAFDFIANSDSAPTGASSETFGSFERCESLGACHSAARV